MSGKTYIGTSGWNYKHWKEPFYPEDLPQNQWLEYFKEYINTVEINNTFYNTPSKETFEHWRDTVPDDFAFSIKVNRYITHMKKLKDPEESLKSLEFYDILQEKIKVVLIQLPPNWGFDEKRLRNFVKKLPAKFNYTMEFRDRSWINKTTASILNDHNIAFCIYELGGFESPHIVTADFVYIRLHGPERKKYKGKYNMQQLNDWARQINQWRVKELDVFLYFDNDEQGFAAQNAMELQELLKHI